MILSPKLSQEEFAQEDKVSVHCFFAGKGMTVTYVNGEKLEYGQYRIESVNANGQPISFQKISPNTVKIKKEILEKISSPVHLQVAMST